MVGSNDQSAVLGHVLDAVELDFPQQTTEEVNNRPENLEHPLR